MRLYKLYKLAVFVMALSKRQGNDMSLGTEIRAKITELKLK
jgi:hypothetical protein